MQALLTAGACINQALINPSRQHSELPVINGCTPLHLAADCGHTALAALLLQAHVSLVQGLRWLGRCVCVCVCMLL